MESTTYATLVDLLLWRSAHQRDRMAYRFLLDGEEAEATLTYGELDARARAVGALLQQAGAAGERALLIYPPGLDYIVAFLGCLYAGVTAVPAYPPNPARMNRTLPRLQAIARDARPAFALTHSFILGMLEGNLADAPELGTLRWLATDELAPELAAAWRAPEIDGGTLAFLQYTSGSTSTPKGVELTHRNLLHNSALIHDCYEHTPDSHAVIWLPPYHDMGLIGGILQPLYGGFHGTLLSPLDFLQRPLRWLQAVSRYRGTTSGGPNFAFELCVRKTTPEQRAALDLSCWRVAFNGAEPIRAEVLERFTEAFAPSGFRHEAFYPCYGLAEGTLIASGGRVAEAPIVRHFDAEALARSRAVPAREGGARRTLVGCGRTLGDQRIVIADPATGRRCADGEVGEIWIAGGSVARGYWGQSEASERTFRAVLAEGEGPFLRTGDLGLLEQGELFVCGRLKDLVIIRGRNHYPQDIELTVERSHPALRPGCGAAFSIEVDGEERLAVVQEVERQAQPADSDAAIRAIRQALAEEHELQVHTVALIAPGSIPKTSSGKIQRHACKQELLAGTLQLVGTVDVAAALAPEKAEESTLDRSTLAAAPEPVRLSRLREFLAARAARILRVAPARVVPGEPLLSLGLDSLGAVELKNAVEEGLGLECSLSALLEGQSLEQLAGELAARLDAPAPGSEQASEGGGEEERPASHGQQALWFLQRLAPESRAYHIARAARIRTPLDVAALRRAFEALVARHASLRTTFATRGGNPVQRPAARGELCFEHEDASGWSEARLTEELEARALRPFELERGPLFRVTLLTRAPDDHVLLLAMHHLIADLWSLTVLVGELQALYRSERTGASLHLPRLEVTCADHARWQAALLAGAEGERQWAYWRQQLAGELPALALPLDRPRPPVQAFQGRSLAFSWEAPLLRGLQALARQHQATLYMTLLAGFQALLHRWSGQDDVLVGTPAAGRSRARFAGLFGYLVNPIVMRARFEDRPSFSALLEQTRRAVLGGLDHQDFPFALLVERLHPRRDPSRSPLFQAMFALQRPHALAEEGLAAFSLDEPGARLRLDGLEAEALPLAHKVAQFDLTLTMAEVGGRLLGSLEYDTALFDAPTMARMVDHLRLLLEAVVERPDRRIDELPLLSPEEQARRLASGSLARTHPGAFPLVPQRFEAQVARAPDALAVLCGETRRTYGELEARVNQLAHHLRRLGVGPEVRVAVYLDRSPELPEALLGVLKAGGVYVPIDPVHGRERLSFILQDARVEVVLTRTGLADQLAGTGARVLALDAAGEALARESSAAPTPSIGPDHGAYVIYTSGSTGQPKGVLIPHGALANHLEAAQRFLRLEPADRVLQFASPSFDVAAEELFPALAHGAAVVLWSRPGIPAVSEFVAFLRQQRISVVNVPSPYWHEWVIELARTSGEVPASVRRLVIGSERTSPRHLETWLQRGGERLVPINAYGPTESTITACVFTPTVDATLVTACVPIGQPVEGVEAYVLDARLQPLPPGIPGELYLGGAQLARGYLDRPELTAERFVPHPFSVIPGARLYRTGDRVRLLADGNIEFLGRVDHQVKVRGFRIELGEIEAVLSRYPTVREAVVVAVEGPSGERQLVAYITSGHTPAPEPAELRRHVRAHLPEYMVPAAVVLLPALPRTPGGKVDRRALPPAAEALPSRPEPLPPSTELERQILAAWKEVLGLERLGVHDNFFDVGGHSLALVRVHGLLQERLGRELAMVELFQHPTIHELAVHLGQPAGGASGLQHVRDRAARQRQAIEQKGRWAKDRKR